MPVRHLQALPQEIAEAHAVVRFAVDKMLSDLLASAPARNGPDVFMLDLVDQYVAEVRAQKVKALRATKGSA